MNIVTIQCRALALLVLFSLLEITPPIRTLEAATEERPNILLVMADDQGWGDMAYNGHPHLMTPNFDEAAATGLRFDRFYAAAPVCSPTRASVMTGRHPNRMSVFKWGHPIRPQEDTIAEALKAAGYATAHFGKWHLGSVRNNSPASPGANGFDEWLSAPNFYDNDAILSHKGKAIRMTGESSFLAVDAAIQWMGEQTKTKKPFLAVVWFGSPHSPHVSADEYQKPYASQPKNLREFYGEITGMDAAFGKLRGSLSDFGIRENTILWYCSDNGGLPKVGSTGGHRGNKGKVYEGGLLVPAILEWPAKIRNPSNSDARCNTCDIYPTLLDLTGVKRLAKTPLDGVSLAPLLTDSGKPRPSGMGFWDYPIGGISTPSAKWMSDLLAAQATGGDLIPDEASRNAAKLPSTPYPNGEFPGHAAWIAGDWKLHRIQNKKTTTKWELYDLKADPLEKADVAREQSAVVADLKPELVRWLNSVVDSLNGKDY